MEMNPVNEYYKITPIFLENLFNLQGLERVFERVISKFKKTGNKIPQFMKLREDYLNSDEFMQKIEKEKEQRKLSKRVSNRIMSVFN